MLATVARSLLAKQTLTALSRQPACFVHHGDNKGYPNVALVFSGCGWWDGTDVHEGVYTMYHLSRNGARYQMFSPNQQQMQVMDHMKKQKGSGENRNMMMESARFSHGHGMMQMHDLSKLDPNSFDADGKDCKLNNDVEKVLKDFHRLRKPIGLASMAPLLACRVLPGIEVTMGYETDESSRWGHWPNTSMVQAVKSMGARHNAFVDEKNKVVSTPAFMWETENRFHYIFDGIGNMVKHVMRMSTK
uniref:Es1 protein n=1 Tax=Neogobius melanostomus TaxID=47308 RepID=A0A8C6V0F4_9GOBI